MKSSDIRTTKVHKDCPFTKEEIVEFKAMLYNVNTSNHCMNPAPISWAVGFQHHEQLKRIKEQREQDERERANYKVWLEKELQRITKQKNNE